VGSTRRFFVSRSFSINYIMTDYSKSIFIFFLLLFFGVSHSYSSEQSDSLNIADKEQSKPTYLSKSPSGAIYRSLIIPGWGQLYTGSYWKAPIFFAGASTLAYFIISNNSEYQKYADEYNKLVDKTTIQARIIRNKREYYRDNRDLSAFYLLGVYVLAAVDAYVDAHLYDFTVDDNLSFNFSYSKNYLYLNLKYHIK
jgi:hypothetical protein